MHVQLGLVKNPTTAKSKGLIQAQLVNYLKISYQPISKWESGMSLSAKLMVADIAEILDYSSLWESETTISTCDSPRSFNCQE